MTTTEQAPAAASGTFRIGGDLPVRRLGFGAMQLPGPGVWGEPKDHAATQAVLRRTVELGITLIDTADAYGPNISEQLIAEALYPYPKDLVIATKGGFERPGPGQWTPNGHPQHLREALEGSLRRLKLERIDLYQLHRIDPKVPAAESLGVLKDMQAEGKIRYIGLSEVSVAEIEAARKIVPIVTVQNRYNLSDLAAENVVEYCEREKIGFIPWFPLATGQLTRPGGNLDQIAHHHNANPAQIALAWLLKRSPVILPIPGTASVQHLEENVAASRISLSDAEFETLRKQ